MNSALRKELSGMDINKKIELYHALLKDIHSEEKKISDEKFSPKFISFMNTLKPQSYGTRIERKIGEFFKWAHNLSTLGRGDFHTPEGKDIEFKTSLINQNKQQLNIVQIRLWENTDYLCVAFRFFKNKVHLFPFYLTHEQMEYEVDLLGKAAHGGKKIADGNINTESSIRFKITKNDDVFLRWFDLYRTDIFDKKAKGFIIPKNIEEVKF